MGWRHTSSRGFSCDEKIEGKALEHYYMRDFVGGKAKGVNRVEWSVFDWNKTALDFTRKWYNSSWFGTMEKVRMDKQIIEKYLST